MAVHQKVKHIDAILPNDSSLDIYKNMHPQKSLYMNDHFSIITTNNWKQPKYPSTHDWINKMYIHIVEYYLVIKENEILIHPTTWMTLKTVY